MKVDNAQPDWLETLEPSAINSLSVNNDRLLKGTDQILVSPTLDDVSDAEIAERIEAILGAVDVTPVLRQVEDDNRSKFGPRSIAIPWDERKSSLHAYFQGKQDLDPGRLTPVLRGQLRAASLPNVAGSLLKRSSAGLPYLRSKGAVLEHATQHALDQFGVYPSVLFTRTQEDRKTRNVWGYPISDTMIEQSFFIPWLPVEKRMTYRSALHGPDYVDRAVTVLLSSKAPGDLMVSVDFSAFDASVSPVLSYDAFNKIASVFQRDQLDLLYRVFRRFISIPIYTPDGEISGPHGVPSGSSFTNTVDSLVQFAASGANPNRCQVQGDDGLYIVAQSERDSFMRRFRAAGLTVNEEKSHEFEAPEAIFLQRYYHPTYRSRTGQGFGGVYSLYRALARIKYPERWSDFGALGIEARDFWSIRAITILENCKHHPGFEDLVQLVQSLDKFGLGYSRNSVAAYSRAVEPRLRAGVLHTENLSGGIDNFETVKVLKRL